MTSFLPTRSRRSNAWSGPSAASSWSAVGPRISQLPLLAATARLRCHCRSNGCLEYDRDLIQDRDVGWIGDDNDQLAVIFPKGKEVVAEHQIYGNASEELLIGLEALQVEILQMAPFGQLTGTLLFRLSLLLGSQVALSGIERVG